MQLNETEKKHFLAIVSECSDRLGNNGRNDFTVENTDENWLLSEEVEAENLGITVNMWKAHPDHKNRPQKPHAIFLRNSSVFRFLVKKIVK